MEDLKIITYRERGMTHNISRTTKKMLIEQQKII